jgi:type I restriction enzyme, S subunit
VTNPKMWNKRTLQELTLLITDGKHGDCIDEENSGYYFISAKDIHDEIIDYSSARQIRKKDFEEVHRRTDLSGDDLVMVNTGATIGKIAIATNSDNTGKTTFQKSVAVIKPNKTLISTIFLKYVFLLRINIFASKGAGSAIKNLLLSEMRRFEIIVPDIKLQNEFAKKVDIVDRMKIQTRLSQQKSDVLFNALSQKAFAGKL